VNPNKKREFPLAQGYGLLEPGPVVLVTTARAGRANHVKGRAPHVANIMPMSWHTMWEAEINPESFRDVARLYGLTPEEIKIVESAAK
jgi:hypothetical protein